MPHLSRRDFLKLAALSAGAAAFTALPETARLAQAAQAADKPNVLIFVFDAMAARHLSVYGYPRKTSPNLERFAQRATVYHAHDSAGNYTTPGTASLLTGMYPWTHRAFQYSAQIARSLARQNIFEAFEGFHRFTYIQNAAAECLADQFRRAIDESLPPEAFSTIEQVVGSKLPKDKTTGYHIFDEFLAQNSEIPASLLFGLYNRIALRRDLVRYESPDYPRGIIRTANFPIFFELGKIFEGMRSVLGNIRQPTLGYYHLWAPHAPYRPTAQFTDIYLEDKWKPIRKPIHPMSSQIEFSHLNNRRRGYDEYITNLDDEFGRLMDFMEEKGLFENSYIIVTSDHGESFERGLDGHMTPLMYDPLLHVPLLISAPRQKERRNIFTPTNSVDLLPTLTHLVGREAPAWCEGTLLPGLGGADDPQRATFGVEAQQNPAFGPLKRATLTMRKGNHKLIHYLGYQGQEDAFELYDHAEDIEEMNDLYPQQPAIAKSMRDELLTKLDEVNKPYRR